MFAGPDIEQTDGQTGATNDNAEKVFGMVCGGVVPSSGTYTTLGVSVKLNEAADADAMGFDAAYDINNKVLVRYHINEFFEDNPDGKLWLMIVAQTTTLANMCDKTILTSSLKKLIIDSGKTIRYAGVVRNPASGYTPTFTGTTILEDEVLAAVPKAQALVDEFATQKIYIDGVIIEGRGNPTLSATFTDLRTLAAKNVGIVNAQDPDIAALDARYARHAAVGTALNMMCIRRTEEELGAVVIQDTPDKTVEGFSISRNSADTGKWKKVGISTGELTSALSAPKVKALVDQGYIFADEYPQYPGFYFCAASACALLISDYAYLVDSRVWNYAARIAVNKLTPKWNSKVAINDDGTIKASTITSWQEDINHPKTGLGKMVTDEKATKSTVFIDPAQDVKTQGKLIVELSVRRYGYARDIVGKIGFQS